MRFKFTEKYFNTFYILTVDFICLRFKRFIIKSIFITVADENICHNKLSQ